MGHEQLMQVRRKTLRLVVALALIGAGLAVNAYGYCAMQDGGRGLQESDPPTPQSGTGTSIELLVPRQEPLAIRAALGHTVYSRTTPRRLVVKVDMTAKSAELIQRPPLNLALVIDRSESMGQENRFASAIQAAKRIIENLAPQDVVSLVVFGERAAALSPAGYVVNKEFLYHCLGDFEPKGKANLGEGILESFAQIDAMSQFGQHKQVILLSDGLGDLGVGSPLKLTEIVKLARKRGIHFSTLGCGTKPNEKLLQELATAGSGQYASTSDLKRFSNALSASMKGLQQVVAKNVKIDILPTRGNGITRVFGQSIPVPKLRHRAVIGDMRDGESRVIVLEIKPGARHRFGAFQVSITVSYDDPKSGGRKSQLVDLIATYDAAYSEVQLSEHPGVLLYANVLDAIEKTQSATEYFDPKLFESLQRSFEQIFGAARAFAIFAGDQLLLNQTFLLNHYMAELWEVSQIAPRRDREEEKRQLQKDVEYQRYLLGGHKSDQRAKKR